MTREENPRQDDCQNFQETALPRRDGNVRLRNPQEEEESNENECSDTQSHREEPQLQEPL